MQRLHWVPVTSAPHLLAPPVAQALAVHASLAAQVMVAPIDPDLADTQAFVDAYDVSLEESANCLVVLGRRGERETVAATVVLATTRADVNTTVRKRLGARRASFMPMDRAVDETGMEHGGITPVGLPKQWLLLVDRRVVDQASVVVGAGVRGAKLRLPGALLCQLPGVEVVDDLAVPLA
jgi:prolyl-tRNA editing enzyme YbaK/EbsC (Cys-tRNA(Pro) deacylase)